MSVSTPSVAFSGERRLAAGRLDAVARAAKAAHDEGRPVLVFGDADGRVIDLDLRGSADEVLARLPADPQGDTAEAPRARGRPRLGVVPREVTLLPRHWDWLATQPGGASAALRRLVDEARRSGESKDRLRRGREALYRFASAMAGDAPGYEEAIRALFAGDRPRFESEIRAWPEGVRAHVLHLAEGAF